MLRQKEAISSAPGDADSWARAFHARHAAPAMSFAVARPDGLVWSAARGLADHEHAVPPAPEQL
jgi:hypothetical protein